MEIVKKNLLKNDKISKNTHIKVLFVSVIDIGTIKDNIYHIF